jgi:hypothetical protein
MKIVSRSAETPQRGDLLECRELGQLHPHHRLSL